MKHGKHAAKITALILQAPVSDREAFLADEPEKTKASLALATKMASCVMCVCVCVCVRLCAFVCVCVCFVCFVCAHSYVRLGHCLNAFFVCERERVSFA